MLQQTGMVFAGGCASGSLWRVGEGHLKLVVAVIFFPGAVQLRALF
ncbi:MAG: YeeE/YedE thiosulfate transporter family protein [Gammaproteobacteria bacterium]|nr:YeeE/YedE thiosulfate transporter family protein [Gammaproteobacteria bacterium]